MINNLTVGGSYLAATTVQDYALFGGGCNNNSIYPTTVDVYAI